MENYELTLSEYWRIMRKRQRTIAFIFVLVMLSTVIFTKLQTPVYEAVLELKIERHQPITTLSQGQGAGVALESANESVNLTTDMQLITSLPLLKKVAEKIEVLPSEADEREKALHIFALKYRDLINVDQIHGTDILNITTRSSDPKKAVLMATAIADVYGVEDINGRKKQNQVLLGYIDQQLEEYRKQLAQQENQLQKFNQNEKVFQVTPKVKQTLDRMTIQGSFDFESQMIQIDNELKAFEDSTVAGKSNNVFEKIVAGDSDNYIFIGFKRRLLELEFERFLLLIDYTEKHPAVIAQDKIIAEVKDKIVKEFKTTIRQSMTPSLENDLALTLKKLFLQTRKEVLYRIVNKFYGDSGSLSSNQSEYLSLKRNVDRLLNSYDGLIQQREEVRLNLAKVIDDVVMVVSPPEIPSRPIKPNALINYLVSMAVGLLLGMIIAFVKESVDSSISTIHDVEQELDLVILGIIPHIGGEYILSDAEDAIDEPDKKLREHRARLITITNPKSWPAESYKMLRSNLLQQIKMKNIKSILFTSSDMQEGKSLTVSNIAISMAQLGKKTLLLGCNMRRPTDYKTFGLNREPGLSDILMGNVTWSKAINNSVDILIGGLGVDDLLQIPGIDNLSIITSGRAVDNISELLNSKAFDQLLKELKNNFDVIIIDCSPVMPVPDAITLCDRVDGVVLIYKVGQTPKEVLKMAKSNLIKARANLLGIILNNIKTEAQVGYAAFSYRYYGEKPEKTENFFDKFAKQFKRKKSKDKRSLNV